MTGANNKKVELKLVFKTEEVKNGEAVLQTMTIRHIDPEADDKALYALGSEIEEIQNLELIELQKSYYNVITGE